MMNFPLSRRFSYEKCPGRSRGARITEKRFSLSLNQPHFHQKRTKGGEQGIAVSYTHLDVYKRQALGIAALLAAHVGTGLSAALGTLGVGLLIELLADGVEVLGLSLIHI